MRALGLVLSAHKGVCRYCGSELIERSLRIYRKGSGGVEAFEADAHEPHECPALGKVALSELVDEHEEWLGAQ